MAGAIPIHPPPTVVGQEFNRGSTSVEPVSEQGEQKLDKNGKRDPKEVWNQQRLDAFL